MGNPFFQRRRAGPEAEAGAEATAASEFAATVAAPIPTTAMALRLADGRPLGALLGRPEGPARPPDAGLATAPPSDFGASGLDSDLPDHGATLPDILTDLPGASPRPAAPAGAPGAATAATAATAAAPTLQHIGRYALKSLLGEGGLGRVHEAWDPLLSRTVAVKTLQFDLDVPTRVSLDGLFLNEARAVAGLSHPYIVTVYDAGLSAHGVYIAMERLRGRDLRQALAAGWQPTPAQAALLVRRVADALAYAHARGVVHCDIKPANIFLNKRDKPKVLDFGIARVAHGVAQGRAAGTGAGAPADDGAVMGSPHYLAPEQLAGGVVDGRTDVYALGVVFHELLTGRKAFAGQTLAQITDAVLHHRPAPAHETRPDVPSALSAIAARAMARQPEDRYASAADLGAALREWLAAQPATALPAAAAAPSALPARAALSAPSAPSAPLARGAAAPGPWAPATPPTPAAETAPVPAWRRPRGLLLAGAAALLLGLLAVAQALRPAAPPAGDTAARTASPTAAGQVSGTADARTAPATAQATPAAPADTAPPGAPAESSSPAPTAAVETAREPRLAPRAPPGATPGTASASGAPGTRPARGVSAAVSPAAAAAPQPGALGELRLAISPWGEVEVNGQAMGTTPPLTRLSLPPGRHQITVRNSDLPPYSATVEVHADEPVTLRHRF